MKKLVTIGVFALILISSLFAQTAESQPPIAGELGEQDSENVILRYGPRGGASFIIIEPSTFDTMVQENYPSSTIWYFPIFSEIGILFNQIVALGDSDNYMTFKQFFLLGGLDQNFVLPNAGLLIGYENRLGLALSVGPYFIFGDAISSGDLALQVSFAYEVTWTIKTNGVIFPISLMFVPKPSYVNPMFTLSVGFMFDAS